MPRVSQIPINNTLKENLDESFYDLISSLKDSSEIKTFFEDFLTKEEKVMLSKRLLLHLMFEKEYSNSEIQSVLGIRYETIRVHKNNWEKGEKTYKLVLKKIASKQKSKLLFKKVEILINKLGLAVKSRSNMKARAKFVSGD